MAAKTNRAETPAEVVDRLFASINQPAPEQGIGIVRRLFRGTGSTVRDSGSLFAEISKGYAASKVAYAVASEEAEQYHRKVIEAWVAKLLAQ